MGKLKIVCFKKKTTALSNYEVEIEKKNYWLLW